MKDDPSQPSREEKTQELLAELAEGVKSLKTSADWQAFLDFKSRVPSYSFNNTLLILRQTDGHASMVGSFGFWKKQGQFVEKGQKGIKIIAPVTKLVKEENEKTKEAEVKKVLSGFKVEHCFDVSQLKGGGKDLPTPAKRLEGLGDKELQKKLESVATANGYRVEYGPIEGGTNGFTRPADKLIKIDPEKLSGEQQISTLAHELGHMLLHTEGNSLCDGLERSQAELEAQSTAYIVMKRAGRTTEDTYSFGYILHWQDANEEKALRQLQESGERISKTANRILEILEPKAEVEELSRGREREQGRAWAS